MKNNFKYELKELHEIANGLVKQYLEGDLTEVKKSFLLHDLIEVTEQLTLNNCKQFIRMNGAVELEVEEAYALATGVALVEALNRYEISTGTWFLTYWKMFIEGTLLNEFKRLTTNKEKFYRWYTVSGDKNYSGSGEASSLFSVISSKEDMAEEFCISSVINNLINEFESIDKHGKIIRCEMIQSTSIKTKVILQVLGAEKYGDKERKQVERVKKRFAKFLIKNNVDMSLFSL